MRLPGTGREEGQVTPALLLAVIGGFAIAVAFVSLQGLLDQTGRAATASDAAALAVAREHEDAVDRIFEGGGNHLGLLAQLLNGAPTARAQEVAQDYADANGAEVVGGVQSAFDAGAREWTYTVTTKQQDTVEGGSSSARSESTSKVSVSIDGGLCSNVLGLGLLVNGQCAGIVDLVKLCDLELNPPPPPTTPPPGDGDGGGNGGGNGNDDEDDEDDEDTYTPPPGLEGIGCVNPSDILQWDIHLTT